MSNEIQKAREVLAKRRAAASQGIWEARVPVRPYTEYADIFSGESEVAWNADGDGALDRVDADLIVLTAGNPELLDAIDGLLAIANAAKGRNPFAAGYVVDAERIAAAILAADERMRS